MWRSEVVAAIGLLLVAATACASTKGPDLDKAVVGEPAAAIRQQIAGHQDWGSRLSSHELDALAMFLQDNAGHPVASGGSALAEAGRTLWKSSGCASCHTLAAGGGGG
jgi:hypothetical protein